MIASPLPQWDHIPFPPMTPPIFSCRALPLLQAPDRSSETCCLLVWSTNMRMMPDNVVTKKTRGRPQRPPLHDPADFRAATGAAPTKTIAYDGRRRVIIHDVPKRFRSIVNRVAKK